LDDGRAYERFWETASRWLIKDPELELLRVESNRIQYVLGESAILNVHLLGPDYKPVSSGSVNLEIRTGANPMSSEAVSTVALKVNNVGEASHVLGPLAAGVYRIAATATVKGKKVIANELFLVREASAELDRSAGDPAVLEHIAAATGARYLGPTDALPQNLEFDEPRIVRVDRSTDVELWSGFWLLLLALLFLGGEWALRQQSGYR
jgi:hypothetical protein